VPPGWDDLKKQEQKTASIIDDIVSRQDWHVPCLVGEFNCFGQAKAWDYTIGRYQDNHVNWTMWTYKANTDTNNWGVYNLRYRDLAKPDAEHDPADVIRNNLHNLLNATLRWHRCRCCVDNFFHPPFHRDDARPRHYRHHAQASQCSCNLDDRHFCRLDWCRLDYCPCLGLYESGSGCSTYPVVVVNR
jgi:hypothetical protein